MEKLTCRNDIEMFENLHQSDVQTITHLKLEAGQEVPEHDTPLRATVIPIRGRIVFSSRDDSFDLKPGDVIRLAPKERHWLKAIETSDVIVIKQATA